MKKILVLAILIASPLSISAQNQHLQFKNIPIDGNINEFVEQLKNEGFVLNKLEDTSAILEGNFANEACEIFVTASPKTKTVWKVTAYLPKTKTWSSIKSEYKTFKANCTVKYGTPRSFEYFKDPYYEGDGYEMQAVRLEKCTYNSYWTIPEGYIKVAISKFEQVSLSYEDKQNSEKDDGERSESIMNDI